MGAGDEIRQAVKRIVLVLLTFRTVHASEDCRTNEDPSGSLYLGSVNRTRSGRACQRWDSQWPHAHTHTTNSLPDDTIEAAANFCRNPDEAAGVWCYTADEDVRWEYCHVPACDCSSKDDPLGLRYVGLTNTTLSGRACQRWDSQAPHQHEMTVDYLPDETIEEANNFCRNPDHAAVGLWCYTTDWDSRFEACAVHTCECKVNYRDSPTEQISSPGYPSSYPINARCAWSIAVREGKVVALKFEDFRLQSGLKCKFDSVTIYDGNSTSDPVLGKFCGEGGLPPKTYSTGNYMLVTFHSNHKVSRNGFKATYYTTTKRNRARIREEAMEKQKNDWERKTRDALMQGYSLDIPSLGDDPVHVAYTLTKIVDVDEKAEEISLAVYLTIWWGDERLVYDRPSVNVSNQAAQAYEHGELIFKLNEIWYPNVVHYNNVGDRNAELLEKDRNAITDGTGGLLWSKNVVLTSPCDMDVTYFPVDTQVCDVMFSIEPQGPVKISGYVKSRTDPYVYYPDSAWSIDREKNIKRLQNKDFMTVTFRQTFHRKYQYYISRILAPVTIISMLVLCIFFIPPDAGEKISLGVTLLLTFSVFQMIVDEDLPNSSNSTPLITSAMILLQLCSAISIAGSVLVLHIHHITSERGHRIPRWLRKVFFSVLAKVTCHVGAVRRVNADFTTAKTSAHEEAQNYENDFTNKSLPVETSGVTDDSGKLSRMESLLQEISQQMSSNIKDDGASEWKLLAQIVDRILMYICLITMSAVYISLFIHLRRQEMESE